MYRLWPTRWETIFAAPIVLALILAGLWLVANAAYENFRLSRAADQIISAVSIAREMNIPKNASIDRVMGAFKTRMESLNVAYIITTKSAFLEQPAQKGFESPWGSLVTVYFSPKQQEMRLELPVKASVCRHLLFFYSKEAGGLGLTRVDVKNDDISGSWSLVYDNPSSEKKAQIQESAIYAGCGEIGDVSLSLSFNL